MQGGGEQRSAPSISEALLDLEDLECLLLSCLLELSGLSRRRDFSPPGAPAFAIAPPEPLPGGFPSEAPREVSPRVGGISTSGIQYTGTLRYAGGVTRARDSSNFESNRRVYGIPARQGERPDARHLSHVIACRSPCGQGRATYTPLATGRDQLLSDYPAGGLACGLLGRGQVSRQGSAQWTRSAASLSSGGLNFALHQPGLSLGKGPAP